MVSEIISENMKSMGVLDTNGPGRADGVRNQ
jgi:hypothetical protein